MLRGHGTASGASDGVVNRRPRPLFGRSSQRKNPLNIQFERQVARLESRQQQQQQRCIIFTLIPFNFYCDYKSLSFAEDGNNHPSSDPTSVEERAESSSSVPSSPPVILLHVNVPDESSNLLEEKSAASNGMSNSDFLEDSFTKPSVNARHTTRRKSKKKSKKHRQRSRKPTDGCEAKCRESNRAAPAIDVGDCEDLTLSPKHVADIRFEETFSPSSSVKEASEEAAESDNEFHCCSGASVSSASYCDETELSRSTSSCPGLFGQYGSSNFRYLDSTPNSVFTGPSQETCCADSSVNCGHDTKAPLVFRNGCGPDPCVMTECCSSSSGVDENWQEKSDYGSGSCNGVGTCNGTQALSLCSDTTSNSDFHLVISKKRARKEKKMSLWKSYEERASTVTHGRQEKIASHSSRQTIKELNTENWSNKKNHVGSIQPQHRVAVKHYTKNFIQEPSNVCTETQNGVPLKDFKLGASPIHFRRPKENYCGKSTTNSNKMHQVYSKGRVSHVIQNRESNSCEILKSSSEPTTPMSSKEHCISEYGESTGHTVGTLPTQQRSQGPVQVDDASGTISGLSLPGSKSVPNDLLVGCGIVTSEGKHGCQEFYDSGLHLAEMIKAVNDAYKVQVAADVFLAAGYPITDLETFIYSATPVISHVPCMSSRNCSGDQVDSNSVDISNVSLRRIWEWYEEPGCYGLEVRAGSDISTKTSCNNSSEFFAYFVPYLSAVQLFGWSMKNMDHRCRVFREGFSQASTNAIPHPVHTKLRKTVEESNASMSESSFSVEDQGELMFEYFETEQPSLRPPLFEKIKELVSGANGSDHRILGDPEKLQNVKLCDLHPASWFCVAWYPVYRVPHGNFRAAFLTYHSLGKLVPQKCSLDMTGDLARIVSPVVGLQSYNDKGEEWFQPRYCPDSPKDGSSSESSHAEVVKERLRTLKMGALAMARAVIPKGTGESVNHHPDYEFFLSRST
ncbi:hypothetical protein ACP70R_003657 [Stipagrostis hirtigluma subsp. patula]